jgi:TolB-like protein/DNA-binding SARP family transcriptional activator/tetratricopeptide (TPR) repeat protein
VDIRLYTLGTLRCTVGDRDLEELPAQRLRAAVLVYVAVERDVTREALASLLWPESTDDRARHALSQKLYELRQVLGDGWIRTSSDRLRITEEVRVDAHDFDSLLTRGETEAALSSYGGGFLGRFYVPEGKPFESWADGHRARLARLHRGARATWIDRLAGQNVEAAIVHARRWVELDPYEDDAQHRLIELLASHGARAEAIRQFDAYVRVLEADDLEPLDRTRDLIASVRHRRGTATVEQALPLPLASIGVPVVAPESAVAATGIPASAPHSASPPETPIHRRPMRAQPITWRRRSGALALVAIALLAGASWWSPFKRDASRPSIAVLPFLNLSADPAASQYLSDGIADELITLLSSIDSLAVAARTSSFRFRERDIGIPMIGDSLDVSLVVEGSLQKEGDRIRVTARLIDVGRGSPIWSKSFERQDADVLSLQQEIAAAIVSALPLRRSGAEPARLASGGTRDPQAYESYLRGRYLLLKGTRAAMSAAVESFDAAVARDPAFALAHADRANAFVIAAAKRELPTEAALASAREAARTAIRLAPDLAEGHAALASAELELWNWSAAEREAALAMRLDGNSVSALTTHAQVQLVRGTVERALEDASRAAQLEPASAVAMANYAETLRAARQYERSADVYRKAIELEPDVGRQNLAKVFIELAMYDSARAQFDAAAQAGAPRISGVPVLWNAYMAARAGRRSEALAFLGEFQILQPERPNAYMIAALYLATGQFDFAFEIAEGAVMLRTQRAWRQLPWDPIWDPVRKDPRFTELLRKVKL